MCQIAFDPSQSFKSYEKGGDLVLWIGIQVLRRQCKYEKKFMWIQSFNCDGK